MATKPKRTSKTRKKTSLPHLRNADEFSFICRHTLKRIREIEAYHDSALNKEQECYREAMKLKQAGDMDGYRKNMEQFKQIHGKYSKSWFTNTVNGLGRIDLSGNYKKIKAADLKVLIKEAEELWAKEHGERVINPNSILFDLRVCRVLTSTESRTHRPVDPYGKRISDDNVKQVEEINMPWFEFWARETEQ